ncbi:DUF3572 domain-containing protein [Algicella marina]|uniref:DUF3572 family protein n=1 Tax=Algicella marina TaxID=2683284 RepID=A0A6P1SWF1_9RHOB|nr:DUF3572 domain-containing protein [Algicella marina]QHQ33980.1 DUF3572 family protein [Algicella marina]
MTPKAAAELAVSALIWLSEEPDRMGAFLAQTGADAANIRAAAQDPAFLGAVLDFVLLSDEGVLAFAEQHQVPPETIVAARAALPGGDLPNWT